MLKNGILDLIRSRTTRLNCYIHHSYNFLFLHWVDGRLNQCPLKFDEPQSHCLSSTGILLCCFRLLHPTPNIIPKRRPSSYFFNNQISSLYWEACTSFFFILVTIPYLSNRQHGFFFKLQSILKGLTNYPFWDFFLCSTR